jgi:hypothetical protein
MPATIEGRVLDEFAVGLAGAEVKASVFGQQQAAYTRTDDQGRFVFDQIDPGEVRVTANEDRWGQRLRAPGSSDDDDRGVVVEAIAGQRSQVELVVESLTGTIQGVVLDDGGAPVSDAFVEVERMSDSAASSLADGRQRLRGGAGSRPTLTEIDGGFVIGGLAPGRYMVLARRRGGGEALVEDVELGTSVSLTIVPNGALAGVVTSEDGAPERFSIVAKDGAQGLSFRDEFFRTQGRWELGELPAGTYEITAAAAFGAATATAELLAGDRVDAIEIALPRRVTVFGRLVDADTGVAIADMRVRVGDGPVRRSGQPFGKQISDARGYFEVEGVSPGEVEVQIEPHPGAVDGDYGRLRLHRAVAPTPGRQDLGELRVLPRRLGEDQRAGDLGYELRPSEDQRLEIAVVRPGGPAAAAGLAIGDVIERVDGRSVAGANSAYYWGLVRVEAGTVLELGLAEGAAVSLTVGPPR